MTLAEKLASFQALRENLPVIIGECMLSEQEEIVRLNTDQMTEGLNADGEQIGEYHSQSYALEKNQQNPKAGFGNVDLYREGNFQGRMYLIATQGEYEISSLDEKTNKLIGKYGEDIFGLKPENKEKAYEIIHPLLIEKSAEATGCEIV